MICSLSDYRRLSKDVSSYDGDVLASLVDAQKWIERKTLRAFELKERTETLHQCSDGRVYPSATPISSVSVPNGSYVDGNAINVEYSFPPFSWPEVLHPLVDVTYIGGYEAEDMPQDIVEAVAKIAKLMAAPATDVPVNATSVSVGDVSISYDQKMTLPSDVAATLKLWRRRTV